MTWLLVASALALALLVALCCAALVEVFRQLADLRRALNLEDLPTPIGLQTDLRMSDLDVPTELAEAPAAVVLFLSPRCTTCLAIADAFRGGSPESVWFLLPTPPHPDHLLKTLSASAGRIILDEDDAITEAIGVRVTPAALTVSYGEITRAQAVSSPRQVMGLIPTVFPADGGSAAALALASAAPPQAAERR